MKMIDLSIGKPISPTKSSDEVTKILLNDGVYFDSYPSSFTQFENEVINNIFLKKINITSLSYEGLSVHHGGRGALYSVFSVLLKELKCEVSTSYPYWNGYNTILSSIDEDIELIDIRNSKNNDLALFCFPNNPDGNVDFSVLDASVKKFNHIIIDLVYFNFLDDDSLMELSSILNGKDNVTLIFSVSKLCAAPNLRVGYVYCMNSELSKKYSAFQTSIGNNISNITRNLAVKYLLESYRNNKITDFYKKIGDEIKSIPFKPGVSVKVGGMFLWITCDKKRSNLIVDRILASENIKGLAGDDFGDSYSTRWLLESGVDYSDLIEKIANINRE